MREERTSDSESAGARTPFGTPGRIADGTTEEEGSQIRDVTAPKRCACAMSRMHIRDQRVEEPLLAPGGTSQVDPPEDPSTDPETLGTHGTFLQDPSKCFS